VKEYPYEEAKIGLVLTNDREVTSFGTVIERRFSAMTIRKSIFVQLFICQCGENDTRNTAIDVSQFAAPCYYFSRRRLSLRGPQKFAHASWTLLDFPLATAPAKGKGREQSCRMNFEGVPLHLAHKAGIILNFIYPMLIHTSNICDIVYSTISRLALNGADGEHERFARVI